MGLCFLILLAMEELFRRSELEELCGEEKQPGMHCIVVVATELEQLFVARVLVTSAQNSLQVKLVPAQRNLKRHHVKLEEAELQLPELHAWAPVFFHGSTPILSCVAKPHLQH